MTCFSATQYPSGVYASSKSCSTFSTSATFFAAKSSANAATPLPMTSAVTALDVSLAICCAAASVSKLALFHFPCRCSVMTRIFISFPRPPKEREIPRFARNDGLFRSRSPVDCYHRSNHARFELQFFDQPCRHFFWCARQKLRLFRLCRHINLFDFLRWLCRNAQRFARNSDELFFLGRHDALQRGVTHLVDAGLDRKDGRQRALDMLKPAGLEFPLQFHPSVSHFDLHDDGRVRQIEQRGQQHPRLPEAVIVALQSRQDQVRFFFLNGDRECLRGAQGIELREMVIRDVNPAVRTLGKRFFDRLLHALRPHGQRNHFPTMLFLEPERFFQRIAVRFVHLETDVRFLDPVPGNRQRRIFRGNLLNAHDNVHGNDPFRLSTFQGHKKNRERAWLD